METETIVNRKQRGDKQRDVKQWRLVIDLRSRRLSFGQIATLTGVSRQRAHQIVAQAKHYASTHDDELAKYITERETP